MTVEPRPRNESYVIRRRNEDRETGEGLEDESQETKGVGVERQKNALKKRKTAKKEESRNHWRVLRVHRHIFKEFQHYLVQP